MESSSESKNGSRGHAIVSRASPFTREEGSDQLRIMSLCCRVSSGQAVQGVSSNSMLFAVSRDAVLAGLFGARHTEYACARLVCAMRACTARATTRQCASFVVNTPRKSWQTLTKPWCEVDQTLPSRGEGLARETSHARTFERSVFSKIHTMHLLKTPWRTLWHFIWDLKTRYVAASVVTDRQTDRQNERLPYPSRMRRGLITIHGWNRIYLTNWWPIPSMAINILASCLNSSKYTLASQARPSHSIAFSSFRINVGLSCRMWGSGSWGY